jgi:hypothetical protein
MIQIKPFLKRPFDIGGKSGVDVKLEKKAQVYRVQGNIDMDELSLEIPGIMRKRPGVKSKASITGSIGKPGATIERLLYNLDGISASLMGNIRPDKTVNLDLSVDISQIGNVAYLFLIDKGAAKGGLALNVKIKDYGLSSKKLPICRGVSMCGMVLCDCPASQSPFRI